jgi:hypothetical protein
MTSDFRHATLARQIERLEHRLEALRQRERRFAWYRLGAFLGGVLLTWVTASTLGAPMTWGALTLGLAGFFGVVALHRRLDAWIDKLRIWQELKILQRARLGLDWQALPAPSLPPEYERSALDVDLDLTGPRSLHHLLDNAISLGGSQRLALWLTSGKPELQELARRQRLVRELAPMRRFRGRLQLIYRLAARQRLQGAEMLAWLTTDYPEARVRRGLPVAAFMSALNLVLFALNIFGPLPPYWPLTLALYLGFYYINAGALAPFLEAVVRLDEQLSNFRPVLRFLERYPLGRAPHLAALCASCRSAGELPSQQLRRVKWLTAAVGLRMNPIVGFMLNIFLPWDFVTAHLVALQRQRLAAALPAWLDTFEQLEALIALAEFADLHPAHAFPHIDPGYTQAFSAEGLGHPLLPPESKVCNDFEIEALGQIALITGSNMAGKSTFIKTAGINLCLAYAGAPVDARALRARPMRLHSCIRISDSIADGFSYFYAEVRCLKCLLDKLAAPGEEYPLFYLIDEIFRGTNNRERLLGSRAYLQALIGQDGAGLIATHDLELAALAEHAPQVHNYHFRDHVQDGRLAFDYKVRPGPSPTTNALKIMSMEGLPVEGT